MKSGKKIINGKGIFFSLHCTDVNLVFQVVPDEQQTVPLKF